VANSFTVVLIAKGVEAAGGRLDVNRETTVLLIGAVVWAYLRVIFEVLTETVQWERWEGTIEYTFMAPLARPVHLLGMGGGAGCSPATYALEGIRSAVIDGAGLGHLWGDVWPMIAIGAASIPLGLWVFRLGEMHAKRHGKLKRSG